jgi:AcrR family transcriptional regulator
MVQAVHEHGYVATTISDLTARAGVSRRTFYEHFENKDECLLATYDSLIAMLTRRTTDGFRSADEWLAQLESVIRAIFEGAISRPDAARLVCVELAAAGPPGIERWAQGTALLGRFISKGFEQAPGPGAIPDPVAKAIVGALRSILYSRVRRQQSGKALKSELMKLLPEFMRWIAGYYPSPAEIPIRPRAKRPHKLRGGRAPGTLSPPPGPGWRGLPRGEHNLPRGFVAHNQRERILDAIANLTAARGYPALGLEDVVAEAAVSLQTFYEHFENKEEAFLATYEVGHNKLVAATYQSLDFKLSWPRNVRIAVGALLDFLASEPSFAHVACMDVLIAYPHVAGRVDEANFSFAEMLAIGLDTVGLSEGPSSIVGEAIVGGVFELLHDYILRGLTHRLPELADHVAYIALTPFIGNQAAWKAISEK